MGAVAFRANRMTSTEVWSFHLAHFVQIPPVPFGCDKDLITRQSPAAPLAQDVPAICLRSAAPVGAAYIPCLGLVPIDATETTIGSGGRISNFAVPRKSILFRTPHRILHPFPRHIIPMPRGQSASEAPTNLCVNQGLDHQRLRPVDAAPRARMRPHLQRTPRLAGRKRGSCGSNRSGEPAPGLLWGGHSRGPRAARHAEALNPLARNSGDSLFPLLAQLCSHPQQPPWRHLRPLSGLKHARTRCAQLYSYRISTVLN